MQKFLLALLAVLTFAACQNEPETQYLMEVTREVTVVVVVTATPDGEAAPQTAVTPQMTPTSSPTAIPSATSVIMPTPIDEQIVVAEQVFENGRMFYLQPVNEIWVLINQTDDGLQGAWTIHDNTWTDGMPEFDSAITPPDGFVQPIRGFGKLWRENQAIRDALGWALDTEYGHVTRYEYYAGGTIADNQYVPGPGYHIIYSRDGFAYRFDETDGTWQRIDG
ncbi:MAG: hypothetical protein Kow00117_08030 [Phototrophicales bacterium]